MTAMHAHVGNGNAQIYTMRDLNQNTANVIKAINENGKPAVITKHGRFVALITPLEGQNFEGRLVAALLERDQSSQRDEVGPGFTGEELLRRLGHD